jgi:hypothetical protein
VPSSTLSASQLYGDGHASSAEDRDDADPRLDGERMHVTYEAPTKPFNAVKRQGTVAAEGESAGADTATDTNTFESPDRFDLGQPVYLSTPTPSATETATYATCSSSNSRSASVTSSSSSQIRSFHRLKNATPSTSRYLEI